MRASLLLDTMIVFWQNEESTQKLPAPGCSRGDGLAVAEACHTGADAGDFSPGVCESWQLGLNAYINSLEQRPRRQPQPRSGLGARVISVGKPFRSDHCCSGPTIEVRGSKTATDL
jgi:hypothetical protein